MDSISDSVTYPMENEDWMKTVVIGGLLMLFSFLLVPLFVVYGYLVRTIRERLDDNREPPVFDEWGELLVDGLKAWVIGLVYMAIPLVVMGVTVGGAVVAMATGTDAGVAAGLSALFAGLLVSFVLFLVFGYLAVAAVVNFAREGRFGAGFDVGVIREVAFSRDFAVAWLTAVAVFLVAGVVVGVLNVIPILGFVLGSFLTFFVSVVAAKIWADGFASAMDGPETQPPVGGEGAAI